MEGRGRWRGRWRLLGRASFMKRVEAVLTQLLNNAA